MFVEENVRRNFYPKLFALLVICRYTLYVLHSPGTEAMILALLAP